MRERRPLGGRRKWRRFGVYSSCVQSLPALRSCGRRRLPTRILAKVGRSPRRILPARQSAGAGEEYGLISQPAGSIQTINTASVIEINGPSPNPAFYELDIGIGRSRCCQTDDCIHMHTVLFAVTTTLIRGGRSAIERHLRKSLSSKPFAPLRAEPHTSPPMRRFSRSVAGDERLVRVETCPG
jgi:hypothetical protein